MDIKKIRYVINHKKAFLKMEKELLGKNTISGVFHDVDKVFLLLFISSKKASSIHRRISNHHNRASKKKHYIQMVVDWECARFTKPDKLMDANETLKKYYPHLSDDILPILKEYNLA